MGAINFKTSDIITMGIEPITTSYTFEEFQQDEFNNCDLYESPDDVSIESYYDYINVCYEENIYEAERILKKYNFNHYKVKIESGYYDGLQLLIDGDYFYYYSCYEKLEFYKELTQIKKLLKELNEIGFCIIYPGWACSYERDYKKINKEIDQAIKSEKAYIKKQLTTREYNKLSGPEKHAVLNAY